eukprot:2110338-Prymnesium_polylepis.1
MAFQLEALDLGCAAVHPLLGAGEAHESLLLVVQQGKPLCVENALHLFEITLQHLVLLDVLPLTFGRGRDCTTLEPLQFGGLLDDCPLESYDPRRHRLPSPGGYKRRSRVGGRLPTVRQVAPTR